MEKLEKDMAVQKTRDAIRFMTQLYQEISHVIRTIESLMKEKKFVRGQIGGGADNIGGDCKNSLELWNCWLYKRISVFFVNEEFTRTKEQKKIESIGNELESNGEKQTKKTSTPFTDDLKVIYLRFGLDGEGDCKEPIIYYSVFYDIKPIKPTKRKKSEGIEPTDDSKGRKYFEDVVTELDNYRLKIDFLSGKGPHEIFRAMSFRNETRKVNMFEFNNVEDLKEKFVDPMCRLYYDIQRRANGGWIIGS